MSGFINRRDLDFLLYELLDVQDLCARERFEDHGRDTFDAILNTAENIAAEYFETHAAKSDAQEPRFVDGKVELIPEIGQALDVMKRAGFIGAAQDHAFGGLQLPETVDKACSAIFFGANISTSAYAMLTSAAINLIAAHGHEDQKKTFIPPMIEGRYFGTMCLSEPQAGSSLADIKTIATPTSSAHYLITGTKMWISGGEHELSGNIIHLVLARIPGGPAGVKGISLFIVPKYRVQANGDTGEKNNISLAGLNHKMGYRGTTNTLLNFGESGECHGYLVGEPHQGLAYMFHMMNEARIGVGLGAAMLGYAGYRYSLDYARERPQGRLPGNRDAEAPAVPIIRHADVRRMLLAQKAYVEGGLGLCLYAARLVDDQKTHPDEAIRAESGLLLDILTPIVKAWPSEWCLEANKLAIQVLGGYGYTRDFPVERLYRDNRLNMIHEGTNGIQGLDLLGRKVVMNKGAALTLLGRYITDTVKVAKGRKRLVNFANQLGNALTLVNTVTHDLITTSGGDADMFLANSSTYMDMMSNLVLGWIWLEQSIVADAALEQMPDNDLGTDREFYDGKIWACRYFFARELTKIVQQAEIVAKGDLICLEVPASVF